jgi:hypothetical protein
MAKRQVIIKDGKVTFIYADKMKPFLELGEATVKRVSHVEPVTIAGEVKWTADMSPVSGPTLGPFDSRQEALDREVEWLNANQLGIV